MSFGVRSKPFTANSPSLVMRPEWNNSKKVQAKRLKNRPEHETYDNFGQVLKGNWKPRVAGERQDIFASSRSIIGKDDATIRSANWTSHVLPIYPFTPKVHIKEETRAVSYSAVNLQEFQDLEETQEALWSRV
mmetsp:Transcript_27272/g.37433  ORF Transcript_27272/g.37433 Transcript_27272/m.37433 type:complete len:133 (-) Transcript_27272:258-656(-)